MKRVFIFLIMLVLIISSVSCGKREKKGKDETTGSNDDASITAEALSTAESAGGAGSTAASEDSALSSAPETDKPTEATKESDTFADVMWRPDGASDGKDTAGPFPIKNGKGKVFLLLQEYGNGESFQQDFERAEQNSRFALIVNAGFPDAESAEKFKEATAPMTGEETYKYKKEMWDLVRQNSFEVFCGGYSGDEAVEYLKSHGEAKFTAIMSKAQIIELDKLAAERNADPESGLWTYDIRLAGKEENAPV